MVYKRRDGDATSRARVPCSLRQGRRTRPHWGEHANSTGFIYLSDASAATNRNGLPSPLLIQIWSRFSYCSPIDYESSEMFKIKYERH